MKTLAKHLDVLQHWTRRLGPYVLLEMLLPGGTLLALLLFIYRRRKLALAPALS